MGLSCNFLTSIDNLFNQDTLLIIGGKTKLSFMSYADNFTLDPRFIQFSTGENGEQPCIIFKIFPLLFPLLFVVLKSI